MANLGWPYISPSEISFGDMELPEWVDLEQVAAQASRDMDASIGQRYKLPLSLSDIEPEQRAAFYLLQKVCRYLCIGRVVIDAAIGGEDSSMHAYGMHHIRWAEAVLSAIRDGKQDLPAEEIGGTRPLRQSGLLVTNRDPRSLVDAFYATDAFYDGAAYGVPDA